MGKSIKVKNGGVETGLLVSGLVILNCIPLDKDGYKIGPDRWIGIPMEQALDLGWKLLGYSRTFEKYQEKTAKDDDNRM